MTTKDDHVRALWEFDERMADSPESVAAACALLLRQMEELDTVTDWEFSPADQTAILRAYRGVYATIRPMVKKYAEL